jgi:hypothetical protein
VGQVDPNDFAVRIFLCVVEWHSREKLPMQRGVRQGDPLSPLLFVLAADLLQSIVNRAWHIGVLKYPIGENFGGEYPIMQYADDTLLIIPADATALFNLKGLLRSFLDSIGSHINFHKSFMVPISVDD